jgi:hypothetical protein
LLAVVAVALKVAAVAVQVAIEHQLEHLVVVGLLNLLFHWLPERLIQ